MARQRGRTTLLVMTIVAAPLALGFETLLRHLMLPPEFELLRELLHPTLTPVAWVLAGVCALLGFAGLRLQKRAKDRVGGFMLGASVPQVPAILATFTFMFGASLLPVLVAIGVVTVFVGVLAIRTRS